MLELRLTCKSERLSNKSGSAPSLKVGTQQHQRVQTQHKEKKRKVQVPLEWCSLNSGSERSPQLRQLKEDQVRERLQQVHTPEAFQFNNFSYAQQAKSNASPYSKPKLAIVNSQPNYGSMQLQQPTFISESRETANNASIPVQQSVPVIEPTLETNVLMNGKRRHYTNLQQSSKLSSILKLWKNTPVRF